VSVGDEAATATGETAPTTSRLPRCHRGVFWSHATLEPARRSSAIGYELAAVSFVTAAIDRNHCENRNESACLHVKHQMGVIAVPQAHNVDGVWLNPRTTADMPQE
jgi:hypothetical protein